MTTFTPRAEAPTIGIVTPKAPSQVLVDKGKLRCVRIASPRCAPCGCNRIQDLLLRVPVNLAKC